MALHLFYFPKQCFLTHNLPGHPMKKPPRGTTAQIRCSANEQSFSLMTESRRSAHYQPAFWSYDFVESLKKREEICDGSVKELEKMYEDRARKLEDEVKWMIHEKSAEPLTLLEFIDDIQRLGLGHRFENDIKRSLDKILLLEGSNAGKGESLHHTALRFRILKQHGYKVSQEVFEGFTDQNGHFKACLCKDVKGMLSLYEASYLASEGETLLHEAMAFLKMHLKDLEGTLDKSLEELVNHAMELPLHRRMPRLEARWFIEAYKRREGADDVLLELAILDFNMVQWTLQDDLQDMSRWWKDMGLASKLHFARDRLMECFFWTVGMAFEPEFSNCRKGLTKVTSFITTIDDVYDVYGSVDELELFTDAVARWDINMVNNLPGYMKLCFLALYNTVNEMAYDTLKEQGHNILPYLTKAWADLCKVFLVEAKWCHKEYTPTFEEYLENGWRSVSGAAILIHAYFLMSKNITKEALECLENDHELLRWPSTIFRLCNDLATSKAELERGESANSISCYMHQTGVSEEDAREHMKILIDESWKKMNKVREMDSDSPFAKPFVETAINLARIAQCTYQYGDSHGAPDARSKKRVLSLIVEPIPVNLKK
ncbi:Isoprene synthase, chloroplastic [Vitis vinifera]|uniref:Isoprene synthase, chloroplastic n=1 Tax=Vitis vinifera TaxID=29760 RepID=A0A438GK29_VITVI|nr:Isoprene synthase, chloroplastic [Vitis vinifera]